MHRTSPAPRPTGGNVFGPGPPHAVTSLATLPATPRLRRWAFAVVGVLFVLFFAAIPIARVRLPESDGFIPAVQAVIFVTDLTTAMLLFTQFSLARSRALLTLANAYLFTALIVVETERHGDHGIAVRIKDSGPGIDPKRLAGVFDAFVTTKPDGTGLG